MILLARTNAQQAKSLVQSINQKACKICKTAIIMKTLPVLFLLTTFFTSLVVHATNEISERVNLVVCCRHFGLVHNRSGSGNGNKNESLPIVKGKEWKPFRLLVLCSYNTAKFLFLDIVLASCDQFNVFTRDRLLLFSVCNFVTITEEKNRHEHEIRTSDEFIFSVYFPSYTTETFSNPNSKTTSNKMCFSLW